MGKLFWAVNVVGIVAAIALWGYSTFSIRSEVKAEISKVESRQRELKNWAAKKNEIVNRNFMRSAEDLKKMLEAEEKSLRELVRSRDIKLEPSAFGGTMPPQDLAEFREWMRRRYEERDKLLRSAGIYFPEGREIRGDVERWDEIRPSDFPRVLRDFLASCEIYRALAEAKAVVKYTIRHTEKGAVRTETVEEVRKVDALRSLRFGTEGKEQVPSLLPKDAPCSERPISLALIAHYNVVLDVMRKLEASEKCLFVVRSARIWREVELERVPEVLRDRFLDTAAHEPPVFAELGLVLVEFSESSK